MEIKYNYNILWWKFKEVQFIYGEKYYIINNLFCNNNEEKCDAAILQYGMAIEVPLITNLK
jgi:hypothetical protein